MQIDEYGRLAISKDDHVPRRGWAYTPLAEIDMEMIFATREWANVYARLMANTAPNIVEVIIRGTTIEPV